MTSVGWRPPFLMLSSVLFEFAPILQLQSAARTSDLRTVAVDVLTELFAINEIEAVTQQYPFH